MTTLVTDFRVQDQSNPWGSKPRGQVQTTKLQPHSLPAKEIKLALSIITVTAQDPASRDRQLDEATRALQDQAIHCGILVTRLDFAVFTVELSPDVGFGAIQEMDLLRRGGSKTPIHAC